MNDTLETYGKLVEQQGADKAETIMKIIDQKLTEVFNDKTDQFFLKFDSRFDLLDRRFTKLEESIEHRFKLQTADQELRLAKLETSMVERFHSQKMQLVYVLIGIFATQSIGISFALFQIYNAVHK